MNQAQISQLIVPVIFAVFIYFFLIRPQKKREKEVSTMRENLKVGDRIVTIGGITGVITVLKEDIVVIESGTTKTRLETTKWSIGAVVEDGEVA